MAESIQCWSCGTRMTLEELARNDGDCPECEVEIHLAEYLSKELAEIAELRAQQQSQGSDAVLVSRDLLLRAIQVLKKPDGSKNHAQRIDKRNAQEELRALLDAKP